MCVYGGCLYMLVRPRVYVSVCTSMVLCQSRCVYMDGQRNVCVPLEKCIVVRVESCVFTQACASKVYSCLCEGL